MKKTGKRRMSRELAMQMLFQADVGKQTYAQVCQSFWAAREPVEEPVRAFADDIFRVADAREDEIRSLIQAHSTHWRMDRMPAVDRNILRAAIAEMLGFPATPAPIIINESLEIAKAYSAPESVDFLNAVLDAVARERTSIV